MIHAETIDLPIGYVEVVYEPLEIAPIDGSVESVWQL
jgi:hypothetical protein